MSDYVERPPIGVLPKKFFERNVKIERFNELCRAISDYYNAGLKINVSWVEEYNELVDDIREYEKERNKQHSNQTN